MYQPLFVRLLTANEKEDLADCSQSSNREVASRARIILLSAEGKTAVEISQELSFHSSNVKKWIRRFNREGIKGIVVKKRGPQGGPRPRFTSDQVRAIVDLSLSDPMTLGLPFKEWTPQKLATAAVERGIVESISHVTVRQVLRRNEGATPGGSLARAGVALAEVDGVASHLQLGRAALSRSRYEAAVEHFKAALAEEVSSPEDEATTRVLLTQALEEQAKYDEAYETIAKYEQPQELVWLQPEMRARIKLRIGWVKSWLRNYPDALASLNEAMKLFRELQDGFGVSETDYALGRTYLLINEIRIARDHLLTAAEYLKKSGDKELLARIYDRLGTVDFNEGAFVSAKENYGKALKLIEGTYNINLLGIVLLNLGTAMDAGHIGQRQEAASYKRRGIAYLEKGGHKDFLARAYNNLGDNLRYSGEWDEAIECLDKAIDIAQRFSQPGDEATARVTLAEILLAQGKLADAETHLKKSLEISQAGPDSFTDQWLESNTLRIMAEIHYSKGQVEAALRILRHTLQLSTTIGDLHGVALAQIGLAEVHCLQGRYDQGNEYLQLAQGRLKEENTLFVSGLIQRLAGQLEAASNRFAEAKQRIAQSISIFSTIENSYELGRSYYEMGLLLKKARDLGGAETNLAHAKEIFVRLGARPYIKLADKALDALASGADSQFDVVRVTPPSDVLLMQRLIEASASRELLVQELATIIFDNFSVSAVVIFRFEEGEALDVLAMKGVSKDEASALCGGLKLPASDPFNRRGDGCVISIGNGTRPGVTLYIRTGEAVEMGRLQPLLKQAELGLETCALRMAARRKAPPEMDQRVRMIMPGFIVGSRPMFDVVEKIHKIRTSAVTVLITGESGTGKELVARAIHGESARARAIFLPFNCTATPKEIIDSQLFGHRRGAFTGATNNYPGIIKAADGGTLFLDEIGDLSLEVQPKLMRFLQESEIQPLGEVKQIRVDVRVLAATNTDLERAVEEGRFREDLFHRLNIIRIHVPPLRDRMEEVPFLAGHFLEHFSSRAGRQGLTLTQDAQEALKNYSWPGNVRQLRNEIERVVAYASDGANISCDDLSPEVKGGGRLRVMAARATPLNGARGYSERLNGHREASQFDAEGCVKLKEATAALERKLIDASLTRNKHNLSRTAEELGLSRRGLRLKLDQLGIKRGEGL